MWLDRHILVLTIPLFVLHLCDGISSSIPSIVLEQTRNKNCSSIDLSESNFTLIGSISELVTAFSCILGGVLQQRFGPKKALFVAPLINCLSLILIWKANDALVLIFSRILAGIARGFITGNVLLAEISPIHSRARIVLSEAIVRSLGGILVYALGYFFNFQGLSLFFAILPLIALILLINFTPESPIFSVKKLEFLQAKDILKRIYFGHEEISDFDVDAKIEAIRIKLRNDDRVGNQWELLKRPEIWKPFSILLALHIVQQFGCMTIFRNYVLVIMTDVFEDQGEQDCKALIVYLAGVSIGIVKLFGSILGGKIVKGYRRRRIYLLSGMLTSVTLLLVALSIFLVEEIGLSSSTGGSWIVLVIMACHNFTMQFGFLSIPNLLNSELYSHDVRPLMKSISRSLLCLLNFAFLYVFPLLIESKIKIQGTFFIFGIALLIFVPFMYLIMPETKDFPLEILQEYFLRPKTRFYYKVEDYS